MEIILWGILLLSPFLAAILILLALYRKYAALYRQMEGQNEMAAFSEADTPVFCMSVYDNLRMGNQSIAKAQCLELIGELGFEDWLNLLPQGLDTVLSESGENVSGGQRQILSVMRAILTDKPILILDEPFSALDRKHADILCAYLERLKEERFILLISHREELYQSGYDAVSLA